ncbi:hypothetical protein ACLOJK_032720 [Asimina triloba]
MFHGTGCSRCRELKVADIRRCSCATSSRPRYAARAFDASSFPFNFLPSLPLIFFRLFSGIEVKPGKPYTHRHDDSYGRLHISQVARTKSKLGYLFLGFLEDVGLAVLLDLKKQRIIPLVFVGNTAMATLDYGPSLKKCVVQCNVGKKAPILLCALLPDKIESCPLNLEFEEVEEVVFSVLGPKSVHLTGFFAGPGRSFNQDGDDTESYGEDIGDTETERSNDNEEDYEDDFIDDGDPEVLPTSPSPEDRVADTEMVNNAKPKEIAIRRHLKKKHQVSDSDADEDDQSSADTEMVNNAKLKKENATRRHLKKKYQVRESEAGEANQSPWDTEVVDNAKLNENATRRRLKKKYQVIDPKAGADDQLPADTEVIDDAKLNENATRKLKKKYQVSDPEASGDDQSQIFVKQTALGSGNEDEDDIPLSNTVKVGHGKNVEAERKVASRSSGEVGEDKKDGDEGHEGIGLERKTDASEGEDNIARVTNEAHDPLVASSNVIEKGGFDLRKKRKESSIDKQVIDAVDSDVNFECNEKPKKRKKGSADASIVQFGSDQTAETVNTASCDDGSSLNPVEETKTDMIIQELPSTVHSPKLLDKDIEGTEKNNQMKSKGIDPNANMEENENMEENANRDEIGSMVMDGENESSKEMEIVMQTSGPETSNANIEGKKKKKKTKSKGNKTNVNSEEIGSMVLETENGSGKEIKILEHTSGPETSDRLLVEELAVGEADGRIASHGDKVSIYYTGRLKETGKIFDSNVDQKPLKLRLGMRIGDKRRFIIPPSLGYGADGAEGIPGDAWLIYEIELTNIR